MSFSDISPATNSSVQSDREGAEPNGSVSFDSDSPPPLEPVDTAYPSRDVSPGPDLPPPLEPADAAHPNGSVSPRADSPTPSEQADMEQYGDVELLGDILSYRERPLAITVCVAIGVLPLPQVSVRVFHDREYLEDEAILRAAWRAYTRMMENRISTSLTNLVRDLMVDSLRRDGATRD